MNIHEYQAKQLLAQYGVAVPPGDVCDKPEQAKAVAEKLFAEGNKLVVVGMTAGAGTVVVSQLDVRALQLAKSAVRVAVQSVLADARVDPGQLRSVGIAGSRPSSTMTITRLTGN